MVAPTKAICVFSLMFITPLSADWWFIRSKKSVSPIEPVVVKNPTQGRAPVPQAWSSATPIAKHRTKVVSSLPATPPKGDISQSNPSSSTITPRGGAGAPAKTPEKHAILRAAFSRQTPQVSSIPKSQPERTASPSSAIQGRRLKKSVQASLRSFPTEGAFTHKTPIKSVAVANPTQRSWTSPAQSEETLSSTPLSSKFHRLLNFIFRKTPKSSPSPENSPSPADFSNASAPSTCPATPHSRRKQIKARKKLTNNHLFDETPVDKNALDALDALVDAFDNAGYALNAFLHEDPESSELQLDPSLKPYRQKIHAARKQFIKLRKSKKADGIDIAMTIDDYLRAFGSEEKAKSNGTWDDRAWAKTLDRYTELDKAYSDAHEALRTARDTSMVPLLYDDCYERETGEAHIWIPKARNPRRNTLLNKAASPAAIPPAKSTSSHSSPHREEARMTIA